MPSRVIGSSYAHRRYHFRVAKGSSQVKQLITLLVIVCVGIVLSFALNRASGKFLGAPVKRSRRYSMLLAVAVWVDALIYLGLLLWSSLGFLYSTLIWLVVSVVALSIWILAAARSYRHHSMQAPNDGT